MHKKHEILIGVLIFIAIFLGIALWYAHSYPATPANPLATEPAASTTPAAPIQVHITEHAPYYDIDTAYPRTTLLAASTTADLAAVATMKAFEQDTIAQFKDENNLASITPENAGDQGLGNGQSYALTMTYTGYQGPHTISYVYLIYANTLGAHPNSYYKTFTFDKTTGKSLALGDLFISKSNYLAKLSAQARATLPAIIAKVGGGTLANDGMLQGGTQPTADSFQSFYLDDAGNLVLIFPPYQVGPYALGTVLDPIPLSSLASILKPEFKL